MAVTFSIDVTPEEQAVLEMKAKAQGVSIDSLLRQTVLQVISSVPHGNPPEMSADQWEKEFEEWLDSLPNMPTLSDEAISRESIYTREDEWR